MKKILSSLVPLAIVLSLFAPAVSVNAAGVYSIPLPVTSSLIGTVFTISGTSSAAPQTGSNGTQHMSVVWDYDSTKQCSQQNWQVANYSNNPANDFFTFTPTFSAGGFTATWSAKHNYTTAGSHNVKIVVHHGSECGKDGSDAATFNTLVVVPPILTVIKHVIGGTSSASNFTMIVSGNNPSQTSFPGVESPGTAITLDPGLYSVSETGPAGYVPTYSTDCSGTVAAGNNKTCTVTNTFSKLNPTLSLAGSPVTYDGAPHGGTVTGSVAGDVTDVKYNNSLTLPTNAGTYAVTADLAPTDTGSYNSLNDASAGDFVIEKADSTTTVTCPTSLVYNGVAQTPCTVSVTGAGGLSLTPAAVHTNNIDAGTATGSYTYSGDSNHNGSTDSENFTINKASSTTIVTCSDATYDGVAQEPCTASVTGVGGLSLTPTPTYSNNTNAGTASASYTFDGDDNHLGSTDSTDFNIAKANQVITFNINNHTFGDPDFGISGTASSSLDVSLVVTSGECELTGNTLHITGAGDCTVSANQGGDINYNAAPEVVRTFNIDKANQSITFDPLSDKTYGDDDFTVSATATSELDVTFSVAGDCTITGDLVHITGAGDCTVTASQEGDDNYNPASDVSRTFAINKANAVIVVTPYSLIYDVISHTATAIATGVFAEDLSGLLDLSGTTHTNAGVYSSDAWSFTGDVNYNNDSGTVSDEITKADQEITFDPLSAKTMGDDDFEVNATATSALPVTFTIGGSCTISGNTITIASIGSCTVTAHQDGDDNYNPAEPVARTFTIATLLHTITATAGTNGSIFLSGAVFVADGEDQGFTVVANSGYHVADVLVDDVSVGAVTAYTFTDVLADHTISVTFAINPACSDAVDNDEDNFTDSSDPGCWTDPNNGETYNPNDNSETNSPDVCPNTEGTQTEVPNGQHINNSGNCVNDSTGGGGGGGSGGFAQCSDGKDNDGEGLIDSADPGCHSDDNASNPNSYVRTDNNELSGQVLGAATAICSAVESYMRVGHKNNGAQVTILQNFLNSYMGSALVVDSRFGPKTEGAVKAFQLARKENVLTPWRLTAPTGIFYKTSLAEAKRLMCPDTFGTLPIPTDLTPWSKTM